MSAGTLPPSCRAFEEALERALEGCEPREAPFRLPDETHAADCVSCASLAASLEATMATLGSLVPPSPGADLVGRLVRLGTAPSPRSSARETLALLAPGALARPEMGPELTGRLVAIRALRPRSAPHAQASVPVASARPETSGKPGSAPAARARRGFDWRIGVALAYAATLVIVTVYGLDPASLARRTAAEVTSAGEKALAEAKVAAERRLAGTAPMRQKLDYRIYRTVAVSKAKVSAYASLLLERIVSPATSAFAQAADEAPRPAGSSRFERRSALPAAACEPQPPLFRS